MEKNKNHLFRRGEFAVGKELRFLHADSKDSNQTEKLSECPAQPDMSLHSTGRKTNSESLCPQYNHRMCSHKGGTMYM